MFKRMLCFIGIHNYYYEDNYNHYTKFNFRKCSRCGKRQLFAWELGRWIDWRCK